MDMDNIQMIATKNSNFIVCDFVVILFFGRMIWHKVCDPIMPRDIDTIRSTPSNFNTD
jgi:hypothetical protein